MAEMFDRQIDRWQMLADRVDAELTEVQKALVQAAARQKEMADEAAKLRQMKDQYLHDQYLLPDQLTDLVYYLYFYLLLCC